MLPLNMCSWGEALQGLEFTAWQQVGGAKSNNAGSIMHLFWGRQQTWV